jgi:hypothetical protein
VNSDRGLRRIFLRLAILIGAIVLVVLGATDEGAHGERFWSFIVVGVLVTGSMAWAALRAWRDWRRGGMGPPESN